MNREGTGAGAVDVECDLPNRTGELVEPWQNGFLSDALDWIACPMARSEIAGIGRRPEGRAT